MSDVKEISVTSDPKTTTRKRRGKKQVPAVSATTKTPVSAVTKTPVPPAPPAPPAPPVSAPVVILAPRKPKPAKLVLVPKSKSKRIVTSRTIPSSFRATRVRLVIDNSNKTQKRRRQMLGRIDAMSDNQVRAAAIDAQLTSRDRVAKVPVGLLRQMLRDFQTMKGALL